MAEPILYILMRNDLSSLNPGKACAQAAHVGNQMGCVFEREAHKDIIVSGALPLYRQWVKEGDWFGTTIVLSANIDQINKIMDNLFSSDKAGSFIHNDHSIYFDRIVDETYPFSFNRELLTVIDDKLVKNQEIIGDIVYATRCEATCFYVFGDKSEIQPYLTELELMP
jgi:hypothetical protein